MGTERTGAAPGSSLDRDAGSTCGRTVAPMGPLHFGPASVPSRESPEKAIELLQERGYTACEIDFAAARKAPKGPSSLGVVRAQQFWMEYPWAEKFGELA